MPIHDGTLAAGRRHAKLLELKDTLRRLSLDAAEQQGLLAVLAEALPAHYGDDRTTEAILCYSLGQRALQRLHAGVEGPHITEAAVEERRTASGIEATITGTLAAVLSTLDEVFTRYNPWGYGTRVDSLSMGADGKYVARVSRSASCE